ncbi:MAG: DivIVA family protein [Propionibacteriaceae bacterium]|jgi:DivIVA domain-containing protein|nr:DivIVA family protein [Propionibacteriaceae bacterium]
MTLSLDDVRNKRFRMARKSGYEVLEVDEFVDEVEEAFAQLTEENQNLKKQIASLKSTGSAAPTSQPADAPKSESAEQGIHRIVVTTGKEASTAVVRLVEMSTEQAERLVEEATADAARIREEADRSAQQMTTDARTQAEQLESAAKASAEKLEAGALSRSEQLNREIEARRNEMFGELDRQRDELSTAVEDLRRFESTYRTNMANHLRSQIEVVEAGHAEPADGPPILREGNAQTAPQQAAAGQDEADSANQPDTSGDEAATNGDTQPSDTPRLDALLGDQR